MRRHRGRGGRAILAVAVLFVAALIAGWALAPSLRTSVVDPVVATFTAGDPSPAPQESDAADAPDGADAAPSEAPSAAAPAPTSRVRIASRPGRATVRITPADGERITGTTPMTAQIPDGTATVVLRRPGRQPLTRRITVDGPRRYRWRLDPRGQLHHQMTTFGTGAAPKQVAFTPDGRELWVSLLGGPGVEVYRPRTGRKLATIDLGAHGAVEVIFTADGSTAYVSQMESASVFEIDTATYEVRRQLPTGGSWTKVMALSPDERRLYASNWSSNDVSEINLATGRVRRRLPTVATPRGLYVTPDGRTLYVAGFDSGALQRITLRTGASKVLETTGGAMRHLVGDDASGVVYADDMGVDAVFVHEVGTGEVRRLTDTDAKPNTIDLGADGRTLYVSNRGANNPTSYYLPGPEWGSVLVFDAASGEPLDAIVGGNQTTGLDVSDDGRLLAFSDFLDDRVQVYEIPRYETLAEGDGGRFGRHRAALVK